MKDYHCCATCIHFEVYRTEEGPRTRCSRLGYATDPKYKFNCWTPKERIVKLMKENEN